MGIEEMGQNDMDWIMLARYTDQWLALVNNVIKKCVRTLLYEVILTDCRNFRSHSHINFVRII